MKKKILLVCFSVILTSCSVFGPKLPVSNGVYYLQNNNTYNMLTANQGAPDSNNYNNLPKITTNPEFLFCGAQVQINSIIFYNAVDYSQHIISHKTKGNECIEVSIDESLSDGVYCFSQNDPLASPNELLNWCFVYGNPTIDNFKINEPDYAIQDNQGEETLEANKETNDSLEKRLEEVIDIKLVSLDEEPTEPGYKYIDFQVLIRNISSDYWLNIRDWPHSYSSSITTAEGYQYDREYREIVVYMDGNERIGDIYSTLSNVSTPTLYTLPPGFHTLVTRERWKISEFATEPLLNIKLELYDYKNKQETNETSRIDIIYAIDIPLSNANLVDYPKTPFIDNIAWEEYKQRFSSNAVNVLDVGDTSIPYDFGELTFNGIGIDQRLDFHNLVVSFNFKNASLGYRLGLYWEYGEFIDGGVGFRKRLMQPISNMEGFSTGVAPGQTEKLGWTVVDDTPETRNWKNAYPFDYDQWEKPFCILIQKLTWDREDMPSVSTTTDVNIVACQDN